MFANPTGFRFGFFDGTGLTGWPAGPTSETSSEKLVPAEPPAEQLASVSVAFHQHRLLAAADRHAAPLVQDSCSAASDVCRVPAPAVAPSLEQQLVAMLTLGSTWRLFYTTRSIHPTHPRRLLLQQPRRSARLLARLHAGRGRRSTGARSAHHVAWRPGPAAAAQSQDAGA